MNMDKKFTRFLSRMGSRGTLGQAIWDISEQKTPFFAVSADLGNASGFARLIQQAPNQFINVGIAEQNLLGIAAGLSADGTPVFATSWAMFSSLRCADQIRNFMGYMQRNIKLIGMDSGFVQAKSSYSHSNPQDIAYLRSVPGITIVSPSDGWQIYMAIHEAIKRPGPVYIRLTGGQTMPIIHDGTQEYKIGKAMTIQQGKHVAIIASGVIISNAIKAAEKLQEQGVLCTIVDMHTIKPLDTRAIDTLLSHELLVTIEEHSIHGGLGSAIAEYLAPLQQRPPHILLGANDQFTPPGSYEYALEYFGLQPSAIAATINHALMSLRQKGNETC